MDAHVTEELERLTEREVSLRQTLDSLKVAFLGGTADCVRAWYWQYTEICIKRNPDQVKVLGVDRLRELKDQVTSLQQGAVSAVDEFVGPDRLWHQVRLADDGFHGDLHGKEIEAGMRLAMGRLAPVLDAFQLLGKDPQERSFWRQSTITGRCSSGSGAARFPYGIEWTEAMKEQAKLYSQAVAEYRGVEALITARKKHLAESEAMNLWHRA